MDTHPIDSLMKHTLEELKGMIDVNTIVGSPIASMDGTTIIPISKVSFGFASGGSEFDKKNTCEKYPFGGGSGAGVSVKPVSFLVIHKDTVRLLNMDSDTSYDKLIDSIPQILDTIKSLFPEKEKKSNCHNQDTPLH